MSEKLEHFLITNLAPTLLKVKPASLVSLGKKNEAFNMELLEEITRLGIKQKLLVTGKTTKLFFFYHQSLVEDIIKKHAKFLEKYGHKDLDIDTVLTCFENKAKTCFPHEIGLLLGYPEADVTGFINNKKTCRDCKFFKVFSSIKRAQKIFKLYEEAKVKLQTGLNNGLQIDEIIKKEENK